MQHLLSSKYPSPCIFVEFVSTQNVWLQQIGTDLNSNQFENAKHY